MGARFDDPVRYKQGRPAGLLKRGKLEKHTHVKTVRGKQERFVSETSSHLSLSDKYYF